MTVVALRKATGEADRRFVLHTWMDSWFKGRSHRWRHASIRRCEAGHRAIIEQVLGWADCTIACLPDDPTVTLGWMVHEGDCLHFVYVRPAVRRKGIARALRREAAAGGQLKFVSHPTNHSRKHLKSWDLVESYGHAMYPPVEKKEDHAQDLQG